MKIKLTILASVMGVAGCLTSIGMAAGANEFSSADDQALVLMDFDRLRIESPVAADLAVMNVRVFSPDNELLLNTRTMGESVEFLVDSSLPDGEYHYETVSFFGNVDLTDRAHYVPGETTMLRKFGTFRVSNGLINNETDSRGPDEASLLDRVIKRAVNLAGVTLDFIIPSANAAAISTAPDGDIFIEDDTPQLLFQYGANTGTNDGVYTWWVNTYKNGTFQPDFDIWDNVHNYNVFSLDMGTGNADSIRVDDDGDIHWGSNGLNFDRGASALSIGTVNVRRDLTIASQDPAIDLFDETFSDSMGVNYDGFNFSIYNNNGLDVLRVGFSAPANSLNVVGGTGYVGIGTASPQEQLHATGNIRTDNYFRGQSVSPGFWIDETGLGNKGANVVLDGGVLQFQRRAQEFGAYEAAPVRIFINAPTNAFVLNGSGYLGLGINPTTPIHAVNGARLSIGGVWQNASSRDLKENIHDLGSAEAMAAFKALEPVTFNYKVDSEETYIGFIAEDVPEIVANNDRATLSSMDIIALLTRVVQDQQNTIETQAQLVEQQNERMDQLETMIRMVSGLENTDGEVVVNTR